MVLATVNVFLRHWCLSVVSFSRDEKKDVFRAIGLDDGVGGISEDGDEDFGELLSVIKQETG